MEDRGSYKKLGGSYNGGEDVAEYWEKCRNFASHREKQQAGEPVNQSCWWMQSNI